MKNVYICKLIEKTYKVYASSPKEAKEAAAKKYIKEVITSGDISYLMMRTNHRLIGQIETDEVKVEELHDSRILD